MRENVGIAGWSATLRFSPAPGQTDDLKARLDDTFAGLVGKPGLTGVHLLLTDAPKGIAPAAEQRIRGSDAQADYPPIAIRPSRRPNHSPGSNLRR
jgi:hypothetical protein